MNNILENPNIAFHGINFDYFKMLGILQDGILSQKAAELIGINLDRNYGGYNGNINVSLCESPSIHGTYDYGAFGTIAKDGISFVVDTSNKWCISDNKSGIVGEIYINLSVPRENILGIMLPEEYLQTSIDKLNIFGDIGEGYVDNYALNFIDKINNQFGTNFDKEKVYELIEEKKKLKGYYSERRNHIEKINQQINEIITKLFDAGFKTAYNLSDSPTLFDAVTVLTKGSIPIYSSDGRLLTKEDNKQLN